jgi:hypothetical protein
MEPELNKGTHDARQLKKKFLEKGAAQMCTLLYL